MSDKGKATLAEKVKFSRIRAKQREEAYNKEY